VRPAATGDVNVERRLGALQQLPAAANTRTLGYLPWLMCNRR